MARLPSQLTYNDLNGKEATEILVDWFRQLLQSQPLLQPHLTLPMAKLTLDVNVSVDMYVGGTVPVASPPEHLDIGGNVQLDNNLGVLRSLDRTVGVLDALTSGQIEHRESHVSTVVNAAPVPGGQPPDAVREAHGLPVPRPGYGPRESGSHLFISDILEETESRRDNSGGREGIVADGYVFSQEAAPAPGVINDQSIKLPDGEIKLDLAGQGIQHAGMLVKDDSHRKSVKTFGDKVGERYSSVNGVYDPGPAGLMTNRGGGGLGSDGRARISFGNSQRG